MQDLLAWPTDEISILRFEREVSILQRLLVPPRSFAGRRNARQDSFCGARSSPH